MTISKRLKFLGAILSFALGMYSGGTHADDAWPITAHETRFIFATTFPDGKIRRGSLVATRHRETLGLSWRPNDVREVNGFGFIFENILGAVNDGTAAADHEYLDLGLAIYAIQGPTSSGFASNRAIPNAGSPANRFAAPRLSTANTKSRTTKRRSVLGA